MIFTLQMNIGKLFLLQNYINLTLFVVFISIIIVLTYPRLILAQPTSQPSEQPSSQPSCQPLSIPTGQPSLQPSRQPSSQPSRQPSRQPTTQPTVQPSRQPTSAPSYAGELVFSYTGSVQTVVVPADANSMRVVLYAAGHDVNSCRYSGYGAMVSATVSVKSSSTLYIYVGGQGTFSAGGFNGGGIGYGGNIGGCGATDIRTSSSLYDRIVVAGGG